MKVFISSVTHMLKDERAALPPFLSLFDHEALLFEQFVAQNRSSREACIAGVDASDVYVLLLGSKYGAPIADTGLSPTHEEFLRARHRGIPILVFNKLLDEPDEPAQAAFKAEVGDYVNGKFWRSFRNPLECNQAVGEALRALDTSDHASQRVRPSGPIAVPWLADPTELHPYDGAAGIGVFQRGQGLIPPIVSNPVLELHLVADGETPYRGVNELRRSAETIASQARHSRFFEQGEHLLVDAAKSAGWAIRLPQFGRGQHGEPHTERFRGFVLRADAVSAFVCLQTDDMGSLIDRRGLKDLLADLFGNVYPHLAGDYITIAAGLVHADRVWEGDPHRMGDRRSGFMRTPGASVRVGGEFVLPRDAVPSAFGDVGSDLATEMLQDLQSLR